MKTIAISLLFLALCGSASADALLFVTVNTSAVSGTSGFLDFQFEPGSDSQAGFIQISNFSTDGTLDGAAQTAGGVSGQLPGVVTIDNSTGFNDYYQPFTYGQAFSFQLDIGGPDVTAPDGTSTSGNTFGLGLYDSNSNPILTIDPNGFAGLAQVNLDGSITTQVFASDGQVGAPVVTFQGETPEPGVFGLAGIGIAAMVLSKVARRR